MDGAGYFKIFLRISLPQLRPALSALGIITFTQTWNYYFQARVLLEPQDSMTLPIAMDVLRGYLGSGNLVAGDGGDEHVGAAGHPALPAGAEDGDRRRHAQRHQELEGHHGRYRAMLACSSRHRRRASSITGARRRYVAFPLGGIGSGSVSLTGSGRLIDWSIRNRPAIHEHNGYSHFAIKAERDGKLLDARVLNGPYEGTPTGSPSRREVRRLRLRRQPPLDGRRAAFRRRRPSSAVSRSPSSRSIATAFPGRVRMTAFSPFIPHNDRDSLDAGGALRLHGRERHRRADRLHDRRRRSGTTAATAASTASRSRRPQRAALHLGRRRPAALAARRSRDHHRRRRRRARRLPLARPMVRQPQPLLAGIRPRRAACASGTTTSRAPTAHMCQQPEHGTLARRVRVAPGERAQVRFAITWNYPLGAIYWFDRAQPGDPEYRRPIRRPGSNYYATQWADSLASGARGASAAGTSSRRRPSRSATRCSARRRRPRSSTRSSGTLGVLRSATVIRLEGGELWALGRPAHRRGLLRGQLHPCLELSAGARLAVPGARADAARDRVHLQPAAERRPDLPPAAAARLRLRHHRPLRRRPFRRDDQGLSRVAQFGRRRLARRYWPNIRRSIEYAWSPENPDRWDPDKTGVLWGRQHHTLDMELFGPNSWLTSMYLAALKAAAEMAAALGEREFASGMRGAGARRAAPMSTASSSTAATTPRSSTSTTDRRSSRSTRAARPACCATPSCRPTGRTSTAQIKYQIGDGCLTDQILGQWHADLAGLGDLLSPEKVDAALQVDLPRRTSALAPRPLQSLPRLRLRGRGRPARLLLARRAPRSRPSRSPTPRRCGPASNTCSPRT